MDQNTPHLDLPYIMPSQAQKHVTHNEALDALDALVQLCVRDRDLAIPPATPAEGDRYIVAAPGEGAFAGRAGTLAVFRGGAWTFHAPRAGWLAFVVDEAVFLVHDGSAWRHLGETLATLQNLTQLGIGTTTDSQSPFAAKLNTALWAARTSSEGGSGDLRYTMNKETRDNTLSLLMQSGYGGRAEIGLVGDDDLSIKVSPDGNTWHHALAIARDSGATTISGAARFNGTFGVGRSGSTAGGIYFNRDPDNPFLLLSAGDPAAPTDIGQFRANLAGSFIGISNAFGNAWGLVYRTAQERVGIMTAEPDTTLSVNGVAAPKVDNAFSCGTATRRWSVVYAATGTINSSDARDKHVESSIGPAAARIVDAVVPVFYRWKTGGTDATETGTERTEASVGDTDQPRSGARRHAGWRAQDIKTALEAEGIDCASWGLENRNDPESRQWLRPDELMAFLWEALRETRRELHQIKCRAE